jgi:DNA-binding response OmpR family regulator
MARILFVNDENDLVTLSAMLLEEHGHEVFGLTDAHRAFEVAVREQPDLVIVDWALDGLTGEDLFRQLRGHPATAKVPVLMISALEDVKERARLLGAEGTLAKPFGEDELIGAVDRLVG